MFHQRKSGYPGGSFSGAQGRQRCSKREGGHFPVKPLADLRSDVVGVESISDPKFEGGERKIVEREHMP